MSLMQRTALVAAAGAAWHMDDNYEHSRFWPFVASLALLCVFLWVSGRGGEH